MSKPLGIPIIVEILPLIKELCEKINAKRIVEIGVCDGFSTRNFVEVCKKTDGELISIDIENCSRVTDWDKWLFIQADSTRVQLFKTIDVLFIDSSHEYKETVTELRNFAPLVRKGGLVLMHDTETIPVPKNNKFVIDVIKGMNIVTFLSMLRGEKCCERVKRAVKTFMDENKGEWSYYNISQGGGLGILTRIAE